MTDHWRGRLSEYLDGELTTEEEANLERHLEDCEESRHELAALREVVERLDGAPVLAPPRDLWSGVASRMEPRGAAPEPAATKTVWWSWSPRLAAAVLATLVLGAAGLWLAGRAAPTSDPLEAATEGDPEPYRAAAAAWRELLGERRLPSELLEPAEGELAAFDRAIAETREALAADPSDADLQAHLTRTLRAQMRYVSRLEGWAREES